MCMSYQARLGRQGFLSVKADIKDSTYGSSGANITKASNGQIDNTTEPGFRQNRRHCQSAVVANVK